MKNSPTFQGRDVFSPCAAWLSRGLEISKFGEAISDYHKIHLPAPVRSHNQLLRGEVVFMDRFGNAITNIRKADIDDMQGMGPGGAFRILFRDEELQFRDYYGQAESEGLSALMNSSGYLEIFTFRGSAATNYDIAIGDIVNIDFTS
jgi:S-adenosylmethionine hydrolase